MFRPLLVLRRGATADECAGYCDAIARISTSFVTSRSWHQLIERDVLQTCRRRKSLSGEFVAEVMYADVRWYAEPNCLPVSLATPPLGAMYTVYE